MARHWTHQIDPREGRCIFCDVRPHSEAARKPCSEPVAPGGPTSSLFDQACGQPVALCTCPPPF